MDGVRFDLSVVRYKTFQIRFIKLYTVKPDLNRPGRNANLSSVENSHSTENSDLKTLYDIEPACNETFWYFVVPIGTFHPVSLCC